MSSGIRIDKEGVWYYNDAEMIRKDIVVLFSRNLTRDEAGKYVIELDAEKCYVQVEDTPFVIKNVSFTKNHEEDSLSVLLSDESIEELDLNSLRISDANILYCTVKNNRFNARFSRAAYYQLAEFIEYDPGSDIFSVALNGRSYPIGDMRTCSR